VASKHETVVERLHADCCDASVLSYVSEMGWCVVLAFSGVDGV
jgi:hypothetical protein